MPNMSADRPHRFTWVALPGRAVCVWQIGARERAEYLAGLGVEVGSPAWEALELEEHLFWQFLVSCHHGPPPHGRRLFEGLSALAIDRLPWADKLALSAAIAALNTEPAARG